MSESTPKPERKRCRLPNMTTAIKQAQRAGVTVAGATINADGSLSLQFGQPQAPGAATNVNEWDLEYGGGETPKAH